MITAAKELRHLDNSELRVFNFPPKSPIGALLKDCQKEGTLITEAEKTLLCLDIIRKNEEKKRPVVGKAEHETRIQKFLDFGHEILRAFGSSEIESVIYYGSDFRGAQNSSDIDIRITTPFEEPEIYDFSHQVMRPIEQRIHKEITNHPSCHSLSTGKTVHLHVDSLYETPNGFNLSIVRSAPFLTVAREVSSLGDSRIIMYLPSCEVTSPPL